ncbi:MAG: hypothetical protein ACI9HE_003769 [Planctomycetota bacterium]|jgi:hypothetical protein
MQHGAEVALRLRGTDNGGIPWFVILDGDGKAITNSDAPAGNVGCPISPAEATWFFGMLQRTQLSLSAKDFAVLKSEHALFAKPYLR